VKKQKNITKLISEDELLQMTERARRDHKAGRTHVLKALITLRDTKDTKYISHEDAWKDA
jgi:hypothetical protein